MNRWARWTLSLALLIGYGLLAWATSPPQGSKRVLAAPPVQEGSYSETHGDPNDLYLQYTISGVDNVKPIGSGLYQGQYGGGPIHFSGVMIAVVGEGMLSYVRMGASLSGGNEVKFPEGAETHAEVRGDRIERSFDFTFQPPPDYTLSTISASALVEKCGGVCGRYLFSLSVDMPTPAASPTPTTTPTPEPTIPPEKAVTLQGKVYAGTAAYPLVELPITLVQGGTVVARTISQPPDGSYRLTAPEAEGLVLHIELLHGATSPPAFQVVYDQGLDPVAVETDPFDITQDSPETLERDLVFSPGSGLYPRGAAPQDHLDDLGVIYYHTRQAWEEAAIHLGLTMDLAPPMDVSAFDSDPETVKAGAACYVPTTVSPGFTESVIALSPKDSQIGVGLEPSVIWHEFGHCLMADLQSNVYPKHPGDINHGGYANPSTTDSWGEGFATFFALLVQRDIARAPRPLLSMNGWTHNFEFPTYMPWTYVASTSMEEYAVTSLLWDLVDGVENITQLEASHERLSDAGIVLTPTLSAEAPARLYGDFVQMPAAELLALLSKDTSFIDPPPPALTGGNTQPHVFDIRQLYAVLRAEGIGAEPSLYPDLTRLGELFIAHGFFADTAPHNLYYDAGETIGHTGNTTMTIHSAIDLPARPLRHFPPPVPDAFLAYQVLDGKSGAPVEADEFEVTLRFQPPYDAYNYSFRTRGQEPGRLLVLAPDPAIPVSIEIRVADPDLESEPLVIEGRAYWEALGKASSGTFMSHTFEVTRTSPESPAGVELPDVLPDVPPIALIALGLLCGGAVLVGMVVVVALVLRSRKRPARPAPVPPVPTPPAYPVPGRPPSGPPAYPVQGRPPSGPSAYQAPGRPPSGPPAYQAPGRPPSGPPAYQAPGRPAPTSQAGARCPTCGAGIQPGGRFCMSCGTPLGVGGAYPPAPPVQAAQPGTATPPPAPRTSPSALPPSYAPTAEPVLGVVPGVELRKGLSAQSFNLVLTPYRLVFARLTSQMLRDAAAQAKQGAKAQGKGFFGQWGAVAGANGWICERYRHTPVEAILREHGDSFALPIQQVRRVEVIEGEVDEDQNTPDQMVIHGPRKMRFNLKGSRAAEARRTLGQVLGELVC